MKIEKTETRVSVHPDQAVRASVIWLHGLGADGNDFVPIVNELPAAARDGVRFIFPHASVRPVTLNGGMPMRAWYDIYSLDRTGKMEEQGIQDSAKRVRGLIAGEREDGVPANRIVLAGFSQGGAIALQTVLRHTERLAGLMALSTYLPLADALANEGTDANRDVPILMCHGQFDEVLPLDLGQWSCTELQNNGYKVDWNTYPMGHEVCTDEINKIGQWLENVLGQA